MSHSRDRQPTADECIVVGSGPSGMACAAALLESGARVTMIDVARDLPSDRQARLSALAALGSTEWTPADRAWLTTPAPLAADGIPQKGLFGDLFMYADAPAAPPGFALRASEALGGLSRVWGATLARLVPEDLAGWPLTPGDLADHYAAVERLVPASTPDLSPQAARILARLDAARPSLARLRASVAPSRLAISQDCRRCGMCLHGCPYDCIFSSAGWVRSSRPGFELRAGLRALRVEEDEAGARVRCAAADGAPATLAADRVFVAAGALGTPLLLLPSLADMPREVPLLDSQYFLLPLLTVEAHPRDAAIHTLSQLFLRITDPGVSAARVHVQLYTYNDIYAREIAGKFGALRGLAPIRTLAEAFGRRLVLAQGYLHSAESGIAFLTPSGAVRVEVAAATATAVRQVWRRLARIGRLAKLHAVPALGQIAAFGRGFHCGGSFPMARQPHGWQSDLLGRPAGLRRIHVVDAACWPSVPSGPVTLTAMANAHRIAKQAMLLPKHQRKHA